MFLVEIAGLADRNASILVPDEGAQYDQLVEINLDEVLNLPETNTIIHLCIVSVHVRMSL